MHQAFDGASRAHQAGDGARAKQLSTQGHTHQQRKDDLNRQAADFIFNANNRSQPPGSIDLHGLFVQEAIERTERAVQVGNSYRLDCSILLTLSSIDRTIARPFAAACHHRQRHTFAKPRCKDQTSHRAADGQVGMTDLLVDMADVLVCNRLGITSLRTSTNTTRACL